ncbi:MAG: 50S ribosomal protein L29 [Minisyncoccales bacterium]
MKKKELVKLREKGIEELKKILKEEKEKLFRLRFQAKIGKLKNIKEIKKVKKNIAQLLTIISEK